MFKTDSIDYIALFPGRESFYQEVDLSFYYEFAVARRIFDMASSHVGENLISVLKDKPDNKKGFFTTALITYCYSVYEVTKSIIGSAVAAAGFSQGEFTALVAAGAIDFHDVLDLVYNLDKILQDENTILNGTMLRAIEIDKDVLRECCDIVDPFNKLVDIGVHISPDQNIISGDKDSAEAVSKLVKDRGARWIISLNSQGAFHSPLCRNVIAKSENIFNEFLFKNTQIPVYSCCDGLKSKIGDVIKDKISRQIAEPIRWDILVAGIMQLNPDIALELGPGCMVSGNTRLASNNQLKLQWINHPKDLYDIAKGGN